MKSTKPTEHNALLASLSLGLFLLSAPGALAHGKAGLGAHVHGSAKLSIALENATEGTLLLESPGDSIIGFEHEATKPADVKAKAAVLLALDQKSSELFVFSPAAECSLKKTRIEVLKEEHHDDAAEEHGKEHGEHNEVEAEYALLCKKPVVGSEMSVMLGKTFPRVKMLEVQVLKKEGQSSTKLSGGNGKVKI